MVVTPHAVAGAVAARPLRSVPAAVAAGVATHLVLDRIPHQDYSPAAIPLLSADTAVAVALTLRLSRRNRTAMAAGAIGGVLPDVLQAFERALGVRVTWAAHHANHTTVVWPRWAGVGSQVATVALCIGALALFDSAAPGGRPYAPRRTPTAAPGPTTNGSPAASMGAR